MFSLLRALLVRRIVEVDLTPLEELAQPAREGVEVDLESHGERRRGADTGTDASEHGAAGRPADPRAELERQTRTLRAIGFAATHIVAAEDWRTGIQGLLDRLGEAAGVSRVTLFEVHLGADGRLVESIRYDWAEPGLARLADDERYQNMPMSDEDRSGDLGEWAMRRARGEVVQATLSQVRGYTREVFLEHGTLLPNGAIAMALGHVVLGRDRAALDLTRLHERVHVRQAERWGPFFIPAYLVAGAWTAFRGGRAYRDNPLEREAYRISAPTGSP